MDEFKGSKGDWKPGKIHGTVITNTREGFEGKSGHDATEYYGGYLIAESIMKKADAQLIAAAPDLLRACMSLIGAIKEDEEDLTEFAIKKAKIAIDKALGKES